MYELLLRPKKLFMRNVMLLRRKREERKRFVFISYRWNVCAQNEFGSKYIDA